MIIQLHITDAELEEMGVSKDQLQASVRRALNDGVEHLGLRFNLPEFDVVATSRIDKPSNEPADLDTAIAYLKLMRARHGNVAVKANPPSTGRGLFPICLSVQRMGLAAGPKTKVSRGGEPVLVVSC